VSTLAELVPTFLEEAFRLDPVAATNAGIHEHDARWPDWSSAGIAEALAWGDGWRERLTALGPDLGADEAIDRDRLLLVLDNDRFAADLAEDTWNPQVWVYRLGDGLFTLLAREFAPPAGRLA